MSAKKIDALYLEGKGHEDSFAFYHTHLRPLLWKYARAIGHRNLNHIDDHLVDEMVDDLLMEIDQFEGRSAFSTWAYVRFNRRCIAEYRYVRRNIGTSLDVLIDEWRASHEESGDSADYFVDPYTKVEAPTQETAMIISEFRGSLSERNQSVLDMRLEGLTFQEMGARLGVSQPQAQRLWEAVLASAEEYGAIGV